MAWGEKPTIACQGENGDTIHSHQNKAILDEVGKGDGSKFLSSDGRFKVVPIAGAIGDLDGGNALSVYGIDDDVDGGSASTFA